MPKNLGNILKKMINLSKSIDKSISLRKKIFFLKKDINKSINLIYKTIKSKKKILICGNGGSAAEAQHFAAEFLVRLNPKKIEGHFL